MIHAPRRQVLVNCTAFGRISHRTESDTLPYKRLRHTYTKLYILNLWVQPTAESAPQPERRCCRLRRWGTSWAWCTAAACTTTAASSPSGSAYQPSPASGRRGAAHCTAFLLYVHCKWRAGENPIVNVWFPFMYSQKWNNAASLFPKQNYNGLPIPTLIYICERFIYFQDGSVNFAAAKYVDLAIYKSLTDTWI